MASHEPDVDHRDLVVAEVGGYGALWLQVKGTTHPDRESRVVAFANYPADAIPESPRLLYLVCLLDLQQHLLARLWLIPSADFNRLAYHERSPHADRITFQFSCRAAGDERWDSFEVPRLELARPAGAAGRRPRGGDSRRAGLLTRPGQEPGLKQPGS